MAPPTSSASQWTSPDPVAAYEIGAARFDAARSIPSRPDTDPQHRLHGHSFEVYARTRLAPGTDWWQVIRCDQALATVVRALDHRLLNDRIESPDDAAVLSWIRGRMTDREPERLRLAAGPDRGCEIDETGAVRLWHRFRIEAAHRLPNVPPNHQCARMHGHGFEIVLYADRTDAKLTHAAMRAAWAPSAQVLDYRCLNEVPGLENPTSEVLAVWLWGQLHGSLPTLAGVTVLETSTSGCHYRPGWHQIWVERTFESAVLDPHAPVHHPSRRLHGHSYRLRLHLSAPLDEVLGWTIDFGDVKARIAPLHAQIDHQRLERLNALPRTDPLALASWIACHLGPELPELDRVDLLERPGHGVSLSLAPAPLSPII